MQLTKLISLIAVGWAVRISCVPLVLYTNQKAYASTFFKNLRIFWTGKQFLQLLLKIWHLYSPSYYLPFIHYIHSYTHKKAITYIYLTKRFCLRLLIFLPLFRGIYCNNLYLIFVNLYNPKIYSSIGFVNSNITPNNKSR